VHFLAERYLPLQTPEALASQVSQDRSAARAMSIRHVQTIHVPADETCFTLFEAASLELVIQASDRFELGYRRVIPAIVIGSAGQQPPDDRYAS
jgi:hypothetical protein